MQTLIWPCSLVGKHDFINSNVNVTVRLKNCLTDLKEILKCRLSSSKLISKPVLQYLQIYTALELLGTYLHYPNDAKGLDGEHRRSAAAAAAAMQA